jgi:isopenicillin N synthase-like dioxygenase
MTKMNLATTTCFHNIGLVLKTVISLGDSDRNELLEGLSRDGFCFVVSDDSSRALEALLSELSRFFRSASDQEKSQLRAYPFGLLRGYFPPLEPDSPKLEERKERYVFGSKDNLFPEKYPLLEHLYNDFYEKHIRRIAHFVHSNLYAYLEETNAQWAKAFQQFFLDPCSGNFEPSVLSYAMHYPALKNPEDFIGPDQTVTTSDPHVDMTTITILPRGTTGATRMFDESGRTVPIYDSSIPPDAILVFVGKTLERLLENIPFQGTNGSFPFRSFRHTVKNTPEEVLKDRDVVGYFFNGNVNCRYLAAASGKEFGSMFIDRRPLRLKQLEQLSGAELTVQDRQYLTEKLFYSDTSPNAASPPITLEQFRRSQQRNREHGLLEVYGMRNFTPIV